MYKNRGLLVTLATKFCSVEPDIGGSVEPDIGGSEVRNWRRVTLLASGNLR